MFRLLITVCFLFSFAAWSAEVTLKVLSAVKHSHYDVGIGSRVELDFKTRNIKKQAIFLGRMIDQDNKTVEFLFLDEGKTRISMINPDNIRGIRKSRTQPIISPIDQMGNTCAAYGFFHFWNQMYVSAFKSITELPMTMESDRRRMQFLEEAIDLYYLQNKTNITSLMKRYGKRFGFTCKNNPFKDSRKAADFLFNKALEGKPILIDFNIGSDMVSSSYEVTDYETPVSRDPRLWIPRKVGQRTTSGHVIVGAGAFISKGKKKLLVLDSNWTEPRVWDLDRYIRSRAAVKEMGFHTCESL
ncbi:MAG: hypothetical protein ACLGHN_12300 [Bacteriovoracia bacterium]